MIPLHVHSNNTFLNGTIPVEMLIKQAKEYKLSALALTDTNSMVLFNSPRLLMEKVSSPL